jgi:hypothetical protein
MWKGRSKKAASLSFIIGQCLPHLMVSNKWWAQWAETRDPAWPSNTANQDTATGMIKRMKKISFYVKNYPNRTKSVCFYVQYRFKTLLWINQDMFASYIVVFRKIIITDASRYNKLKLFFHFNTQKIRSQVPDLTFLVCFWRAGVFWPLLCLCRPFMIFRDF